MQVFKSAWHWSKMILDSWITIYVVVIGHIIVSELSISVLLRRYSNDLSNTCDLQNVRRRDPPRYMLFG